jgi:tetratricopeptide (TPR) repeat protein
MPTPFLSSEDYDERAHALYDEGKYDEALDLLREGLALYPTAVELHVGVGYARLAREEYAWARRSFDEALVLDPEHEDALAGLGEVLLKFGQTEAGLRAFEQTLVLGYDDDVDLMLQIGRALFREGFVEDSLAFFERGVSHAPDSAEAAACVGYAEHRLGHDAEAMTALRRALSLDADFSEARVYLANLLYDTGDLDAALAEFERTTPEDHWDELGIWRLIELKKSVYRLKDDDAEFKPWEARLEELTGDPDPIDELLAEVEQRMAEQENEAVSQAQGQLEIWAGCCRARPAATD